MKKAKIVILTPKDWEQQKSGRRNRRKPPCKVCGHIYQSHLEWVQVKGKDNHGFSIDKWEQKVGKCQGDNGNCPCIGYF